MPAEPLKLVPAAIEFALLRHEGHFRKHSRVPYIVHPLRIFATLTLRVGIKDEAALAAAILHDTIEDTRTDYDELLHQFGREVADLVRAMTKDTRMPEEERETAFLKQVLEAPLKARIIKLADNYDNLSDRVRENDAKEMVRSALQKKPHIDAICASLPEEYQWFCDEVKAVMNRCLAAR
ncbi:MAG: HD domain-containing protein [Planctomycetota bacterium]